MGGCSCLFLFLEGALGALGVDEASEMLFLTMFKCSKVQIVNALWVIAVQRLPFSIFKNAEGAIRPSAFL